MQSLKSDFLSVPKKAKPRLWAETEAEWLGYPWDKLERQA